MTATTATPAEAQTLTVTKPNGEAVAALLSAMIGILTLGSVHFASDKNKAFSDFLLAVGKAWIPNAQGIGPYSGKETFMLIGWLGSWALMHFTLRHRNIRETIPMIVFVAGLALATLFIYTPFINFATGG